VRDFISSRACAIPPSGIRKFFDIAENLEDVISLGVGEPDFSTPWSICEPSIYAIEQGRTSYTSNKGMPQLRQALAEELKSLYGLEYDFHDEIIITTGVSEGLDIAVRAVVDAGDEVLVAEPSYVSYAPCVTLAGGTPVPVPCTAADGYKVTPDLLLEWLTPKTKALILNFPNNPTGATMTRSDYEGIADVLTDHDILLISDEVYSELTYEQKHCSPASLAGLRERTITLNGFSKAYAMTGWRIGYFCAPCGITAAALKIHQYVMLCAPVMGQVAALEALRHAREDKTAMFREFWMRRNMFVRGLNRIGLPCHMPEGAFYAFPSTEGTGLSDSEFAERLLKEQHVAVVPGSAFGESGKDHVRCAYAASRDNLTEALRRMETFLATLS